MNGGWTKEQWIFWIFLTIVVTIVCYGYAKFFNRSSTEEGAKKRVAKALGRFGRSRGYQVLENVTLSHAGKTAQVDALLIGTFGVLFVRAIHNGVIIYGEPRSPYWRKRERELNEEFPNPLLEMEGHQEILRGILGKQDIYSVPMESLVVFAETAMTPELFLSNPENAVIFKDLKKYLRQSRFEKDAGVDVAKVAQAIREAQPASSEK